MHEQGGFLRNVDGEWARALTPDAYEKDAGGKANALFNLRAYILAEITALTKDSSIAA
jgi:hypothetical protein